MKACILRGLNDFVFGKCQKPKPKANEVLLKVRACGICSSDLDRIHKSGAYFYPIILGHEISGEIVALGKNAPKNLLHKKAVIFPLLPCFKCQNCAKNLYAQCENYSYFGSRQNGGFVQFLAVNVWNLRIFSDLDFDIAALCEPAAVSKNALNAAQNANKIIIVGSGIIGIFIALFAKLENVMPYFYTQNSRKIAFLKSLGFTHFVSDFKAKFDAVFECVGSNEALETCINLAKSRAKIILVGNPNANIALKREIWWKILRQELHLQGIWNSIYPKDWDFVLKNISKIPAKDLITHKFSLNAANEAIDTLLKAKFKIKGMFINE